VIMSFITRYNIKGVKCFEGAIVMGQEQQFWWNWWASVAVAVATFLAVAVALFGTWLRSKLFPPVLRLSLLSVEGEAGQIQRVGNEARENARFYHVRVSNGRRLVSPATNVQVFLIRVEEPGPDGALQVAWFGNVPMTWRDQQLYPLLRTVGPGIDCDLCTVGEQNWLTLSVLIAPFSLQARREAAGTIVVSLQARSNQTDSPICRIQLAWNGRWDNGVSEMRRNLVIRELSGRAT
jgi:hypothetical protein